MSNEIKSTHRGRYVSLVEYENKLVIQLPVDSRDEFIEDILPTMERHGIIAAESEMFEDIVCNSEWEYGDVGDLGALSSAPYLSREIEHDENSYEIKSAGRVFYYADYMTHNIVEELARVGEVTYRLAPETES